VCVVLPEDDAHERQRRIGRRFNAAVVRMMGTDLLTVRVDLEPPTLAGDEPDDQVAGQPQTSAGPDRKRN
jgi:hypothetical protein